MLATLMKVILLIDSRISIWEHTAAASSQILTYTVFIIIFPSHLILYNLCIEIVSLNDLRTIESTNQLLQGC
jgi:hypothetical protein